jgi:hypothetical protein
MPFKSQAQRRFMYHAESVGKVPKGTAARWQEHTPKGKKLPEKVAMTLDEMIKRALAYRNSR